MTRKLRVHARFMQKCLVEYPAFDGKRTVNAGSVSSQNVEWYAAGSHIGDVIALPNLLTGRATSLRLNVVMTMRARMEAWLAVAPAVSPPLMPH